MIKNDINLSNVELDFFLREETIVLNDIKFDLNDILKINLSGTVKNKKDIFMFL